MHAHQNVISFYLFMLLLCTRICVMKTVASVRIRPLHTGSMYVNLCGVKKVVRAFLREKLCQFHFRYLLIYQFSVTYKLSRLDSMVGSHVARLS